MTTEEFVRAQGGLVVPWEQAMQARFDLILAASPTGVSELLGKVMLMPHAQAHSESRLRYRSVGRAGRGACPLPGSAFAGPPRRIVACRARLEFRVGTGGSGAVLSTGAAGDGRGGRLLFDRLTASLPYRDHYRQALGVREGQQLVTVTSTWRRESTFGSHSDIFGRLLTELPRDQYRVAAILHPNIWTVHGAWQVRAWLADTMRDGLMVLPPEESPADSCPILPEHFHR